MKTKEEILSTFNTPEGAYWAYRQGLQEGFANMQNALRNQAAIAAMQGTITILSSSNRIPKEIAEFAVACADALIEELKKQK